MSLIDLLLYVRLVSVIIKLLYQKVLIEDAISESRVEVNEKDRREIDIVVFEATNGIGKHSNKRSLQLDKGFDVDLNYFGQGTFQKNLMAEDGTAVYLQPLAYGPDMTRVRYNAMYLDKTGNYQAVLKDGIPVTFDLDEIMAVINPDYDDEL